MSNDECMEEQGSILLPEVVEKNLEPERWLKWNAEKLDEKIQEFNEKAEEIGADVIVAFTMTPEEREEFLDGLNPKDEE